MKKLITLDTTYNVLALKSFDLPQFLDLYINDEGEFTIAPNNNPEYNYYQQLYEFVKNNKYCTIVEIDREILRLCGLSEEKINFIMKDHSQSNLMLFNIYTKYNALGKHVRELMNLKVLKAISPDEKILETSDEIGYSYNQMYDKCRDAKFFIDDKILQFALKNNIGEYVCDITEIINIIEEQFKVEDIDFDVDIIKKDNNCLIKYLEHIAFLEINIYSLKERYKAMVHKVHKDGLIYRSLETFYNNENHPISIENNAKKSDNELEILDDNSELSKVIYELKYIISLIKQNIETRNKLFSYGIVYGKYRDFVSVTTFIEYLKSGRCNSLEGTNGAYNLYEQESKANMIINKLDKVIENLNSIQDNQYFIYNEIKKANDSLESINKNLLVNNCLSVVQIDKLNSIIDNTKETAYNTEVAAYYSKKNARLTSALCFMELFDI